MPAAQGGGKVTNILAYQREEKYNDGMSFKGEGSMPDTEGPEKKEKREFMREKIVKPPMSKRQIAKRLVLFVCFAAAFGAISAVSFTAARPLADRYLGGQDAAEGVVFDGQLCGQRLEPVGAAGGEDEPEAEARIPAGELPADAGGCAGDPYSFRHGSSLFCKAGGPVDGVQLFVGEAGVVEGGGVAEVVGQGGTACRGCSVHGGDFLSFILPHCSTEAHRNP